MIRNLENNIDIQYSDWYQNILNNQKQKIKSLKHVSLDGTTLFGISKKLDLLYVRTIHGNNTCKQINHKRSSIFNFLFDNIYINSKWHLIIKISCWEALTKQVKSEHAIFYLVYYYWYKERSALETNYLNWYYY